MKRPVKYCVVLGDDSSGTGILTFEDNVKKKLNSGYELYGPLNHSVVVRRKEFYQGYQNYSHTVYLAQALVQYEDVADIPKVEEDDSGNKTIQSPLPRSKSLLEKIKTESDFESRLLERGYCISKENGNNGFCILRNTTKEVLGAFIKPSYFDEFIRMRKAIAGCRCKGDESCYKCHNLYAMKENVKKNFSHVNDENTFVIYRGVIGSPLLIKNDVNSILANEDINVDILGMIMFADTHNCDMTLAGYK